MRLASLKGLFQAVVLLMMLLLVALVSAVMTMHFAIHGAEVRVPDLKGMTLDQARSQTAGLGLNFEVDNRYYSADVASGHILTQSPAPGSVVRREWRMRVSESLGPQRVEVPNLLGENDRAATLNLRRVGLDAGTLAHLPWPDAADGTVIAQDPPPKAQGIERPSIALLISTSDSESADGYVMPDLTGLPIVSAQALLNRLGVKQLPPVYQAIAIPAVPRPTAVGSNGMQGPAPIAAPQPIVAPGTVMAQHPAAGARVDLTTGIQLVVSR